MKHLGERGFSKIALTFILPFVALLIAFAVYKIFLIPPPVLTGIEGFRFLPLQKTIKLEGSNISSLQILAIQQGKEIEVLKDRPQAGRGLYALDIKPLDLGLSDGPALITIRMKSGIYKSVQHDIKAVIDTVAPTLEVMRSPAQASEGSVGVAVISSKGADSVYVGTGDLTFRAYPSPGSLRTEAGSARIYYAFFPVPFGVSADSVYYAAAEDEAGNRSRKVLAMRVAGMKHQKSRISINKSFISRVVAPLLNELSVPDPVAAFRKVNEEWRANSLKRLLDIGDKTEPLMLWDGRFIQLRNSKVMAMYGDERDYVYEGQKISSSVHLGYDLASYAHAPVSAANSGIVRFAGDLSIYGNAVIIDHGLGLMSLYGHLSSIGVQEGQEVKKGDVIGRTGDTGLAGGDHLHFGILAHGIEVSPLYWWDERWIRNNITDYLHSGT